MAIVGALQSGLSGNHETQYTKAILDFISAIILASTLGWGVTLAAASVFVLQGSVVLLTQLVEPYLNGFVNRRAAKGKSKENKITFKGEMYYGSTKHPQQQLDRRN